MQTDQQLPWQPISTAPKDGTLLLLLLSKGSSRALLASVNRLTEEGGLWRTIGLNCHELGGNDVWVTTGFCWSHKRAAESDLDVVPTHWQSIPRINHLADR